MGDTRFDPVPETDVHPQLKAELDALSSVEHRFRLRQRRIMRAALPEPAKTSLLRELAISLRDEREPHVLELARLHQMAMSSKLFDAACTLPREPGLSRHAPQLHDARGISH